MTDHFERLQKILPESKRSSIFPCIEELVSKKPFLGSPSQRKGEPSRLDITQFIVAWFKHVGLSADECRQWLIDFCTEILSMISSSSRSGIIHGTKWNMKYVFNSEVSFECSNEGEEPACVRCKKRYPVYIQIFHEVNEKRSRERRAIMLSQAADRVMQERAPIIGRYREQFDRAMQFIEEKTNEGISRKDVVVLLNEEGYKTGLGRTWTYNILIREMARHNIRKPKSDSLDLSVKGKYKAQFDEAWGIVLKKFDQGERRKDIVRYLNEKGYKTRTGRQWTYAILLSELSQK